MCFTAAKFPFFAVDVKSNLLFFWIGAWYLCSLGTLFLNKSILNGMPGNEYILGIVQIGSTALYGYLAEKLTKNDNQLSQDMLPIKVTAATSAYTKKSNFIKDMFFLGIMRALTVGLGLLALSRVSVSFTETIKSSAPFFTVILTYLMLGQRTSWQVNLSLIPVMSGLVLCTMTEIKFEIVGFFAAITTIIFDCIQNVYSKKILQVIPPFRLQYYTRSGSLYMHILTVFLIIWVDCSVIFSSLIYIILNVCIYYTFFSYFLLFSQFISVNYSTSIIFLSLYHVIQLNRL